MPFCQSLTLGLFFLNIVTLADMIDVPYVIAENKVENYSRIKITPVKNLVISSDQRNVIKIPCTNLDSGASHFLKDPASIYCTPAIFTMMLFTKPRHEELSYKLQYCYGHSGCQAVKTSNITVGYTHDLCFPSPSPSMEYLGGPKKVVKIRTASILTSTTLSPVPSNSSTNG